MKKLVKSVTPRFVWEGLKSFHRAFMKRRLNFRMHVPWIRRRFLPDFYKKALVFVNHLPEDESSVTGDPVTSSANPLWDYAVQHVSGPGFWKWDHYYEAYHRHLNKFVGRQVNVCEVGIFSGGSIDMWLSYFGDGCHVYGIDLEEACKKYESKNVTIKIGDQENVEFWRLFKAEAPRIDILIDDGGHTPRQQMVTLEQMLPHLAPGGVFICEDIYGINNRFSAYAAALVDRLNAKQQKVDAIGVQPTRFQSLCHSIHFYPYILVIEKHLCPPTELICPKRGTEWSPYYRYPK